MLGEKLEERGRPSGATLYPFGEGSSPPRMISVKGPPILRCDGDLRRASRTCDHGTSFVLRSPIAERLLSVFRTAEITVRVKGPCVMDWHDRNIGKGKHKRNVKLRTRATVRRMRIDGASVGLEDRVVEKTTMQHIQWRTVKPFPSHCARLRCYNPVRSAATVSPSCNYWLINLLQCTAVDRRCRMVPRVKASVWRKEQGHLWRTHRRVNQARRIPSCYHMWFLVEACGPRSARIQLRNQCVKI